MEYYKKSTDYLELFKLIHEGNEIICYCQRADINGQMKKHLTFCAIVNGRIMVAGIDVLLHQVYEKYLTEKARFVRMCSDLNIIWIEK